MRHVGVLAIGAVGCLASDISVRVVESFMNVSGRAGVLLRVVVRETMRIKLSNSDC